MLLLVIAIPVYILDLPGSSVLDTALIPTSLVRHNSCTLITSIRKDTNTTNPIITCAEEEQDTQEKIQICSISEEIIAVNCEQSASDEHTNKDNDYSEEVNIDDDKFDVLYYLYYFLTKIYHSL